MSTVFIALQTNEETRPIVEAIIQDNPDCTVNEQPAMVKIDAQGKLVVRRETIADGIVAAAREIAEATNIKAIVCFSQSGQTVSLVARERARVPVIALTPLMSTARRMALTWGSSAILAFTRVLIVVSSTY
mgnify:CR=1 FL=1